MRPAESQYIRKYCTVTPPVHLCPRSALYCLIGCCDPNDSHSDIADKIDDYLWLKLCQLHLDDSAELQGQEQLTLNQLQKLLLEEYGARLGLDANLVHLQPVFGTLS